MAKPLNRPFRRLRELERKVEEAASAARATAGSPPDDDAHEGPRSFSEVASRDGIARTPAAPARVAPPVEPPRVVTHREPDREHLFSVNVDGERVEGRRDDADHLVLSWLSRQHPGATLDLHGMNAELARRTLHRFVRARRDRGDAVVLIVTGRGRRSKGGPVLQSAAPEWLTEPVMSAHVRAFASAPNARGGAGALLVLLDSRR